MADVATIVVLKDEKTRKKVDKSITNLREKGLKLKIKAEK